ncbi:MAG: iron-containing alcohol dehydrogenase [Rhodobacteraceae bacterium]|jgi:alcohol dehydrogenase class IV|nr:iron-containing alcohol dehydrogenase [Paracoccaceae bacterium]
MSLIAYVTRIHFADRVLEDALPEELRKLGIARPLLLTDTGPEAIEARERLEDALPGGAALLADLGAETNSAPDALRRQIAGAACDGIVALGGARALDLARQLAAGGQLRLIAVPTGTRTIGIGPTGAGFAADHGREAAVPDVILCDPTLTLHTGREETAAAGMDALTHCIESYLATAYNPPADGIAIEGVRRAGLWLERAVADGRNLEARREVMAVALNAGLAAQKGQGGTEAAARAVEAEAGLASCHGISHVALLPQVLAFNAPAVEEKFGALRLALGLAPGADLRAALTDLGARIGLPLRLSALGLGRADLRRAARRAAADPANRTNPRHATEADYLGILEAAL